MVSQCLDRRIATKESLVSEIKTWERQRNREKTRIKWMFTVDRAREKLGKAYPIIDKRPIRGAAAQAGHLLCGEVLTG